MVSTGGTSIYSFNSMSYNRRVVLEIFNATDGATLGARYQSTANSFTAAIDLQLNGTILYAFALQVSTPYLFVFNTTLTNLTWIHKFQFDSTKGSLLKNNQGNM